MCRECLDAGGIVGPVITRGDARLEATFRICLLATCWADFNEALALALITALAFGSVNEWLNAIMASHAIVLDEGREAGGIVDAILAASRAAQSKATSRIVWLATCWAHCGDTAVVLALALITAICFSSVHGILRGLECGSKCPLGSKLGLRFPLGVMSCG